MTTLHDPRTFEHGVPFDELARLRGAGADECDFVKEVAADLPLLALADVLGVPAEDRWLMFDWSNRVIGFLDPDYAVSAAFDADSGSEPARQAVAVRPDADADGRMPDPRSRAGMPDLYRYAHLLAAAKRADPGADVMSILLAQLDDVGTTLSVEEFENMLLVDTGHGVPPDRDARCHPRPDEGACG